MGSFQHLVHVDNQERDYASSEKSDLTNGTTPYETPSSSSTLKVDGDGNLDIEKAERHENCRQHLQTSMTALLLPLSRNGYPVFKICMDNIKIVKRFLMYIGILQL